jgi:hypothetical protein
MTWKRNVLVVANVTATSPELLQELDRRSHQQPTTCTLIIPATRSGGGREAAAEQLRQALEQLREAGLEVDGSVGHPDPIVAVTEVWDPKRHDEILVSTLPMRVSKWLHAGLPERVGKITGAPVSHVVCDPPKPQVEAAAPPSRSDSSAVLGPLSVLGWGGRKHE